MDGLIAIWEKINAGGPAVILVLMLVIAWLLQDRKTLRAERDRLQAQKDALNDRTLNVANDAAGAIRDFRDLLYRGAEKSK